MCEGTGPKLRSRRGGRIFRVSDANFNMWGAGGSFGRRGTQMNADFVSVIAEKCLWLMALDCWDPGDLASFGNFCFCVISGWVGVRREWLVR
jgi:hypothetical protein